MSKSATQIPQVQEFVETIHLPHGETIEAGENDLKLTLLETDADIAPLHIRPSENEIKH